MPKADRNYHTFRVVNANTALCGCGQAFMCGTSLADQRGRHLMHLMELDRYETERDEQRASEAQEYGDPQDLYNRQDQQRAERVKNTPTKRRS